jgi:hypothetical protein
MAITIGIIALVVICIVLALTSDRGRSRARSGFNGFTWFDGGAGGSDCGGGFDGGGGVGGDGGGC